jgi:chromate transporter
MSMIPGLMSAFAQVGICAFGGGLSTLPLIQYQLVTRTNWLTPEQFNQVVGLSQVTPGPIAVNAATFVGYQQAGVWGSFCSTLALVAAPVAALCAVIFILQKCSAESSKRFKRLLRPLVAGLLTLAILSPLKGTYQNGWRAVALFAAGLLLIQFCKFLRDRPPLMLVIFGLIGMLFL